MDGIKKVGKATHFFDVGDIAVIDVTAFEVEAVEGEKSSFITLRAGEEVIFIHSREQFRQLVAIVGKALNDLKL